MIGIYKITNLTNNHSYIGQSRQIAKRWKHHITSAYNENDHSYNYPLQRAIRKYGESQFNFEILEQCQISELNDKEVYWIKYYQPIYNQTIGDYFNISPQKLSYEQVQEIQQLLIADQHGNISHKDLAIQYNVHKDTIRDINVGRTWFNENLTYPLHYARFSKNPNKEQQKYCVDCGVPISYYAKRCQKCNGIFRKQEKPISREELKKLIRSMPFTKIGELFQLSDNAIRKWCKAYNLPTTKKEIKAYSDEEWKQL